MTRPPDPRPWWLRPWLTLRVQLALGLVFLISAWPKLLDPPTFAAAIWRYQLLPAWALRPVALVLPWLEILCGLALCLGCWVRAAATWVGALLLIFMVALGINLARQHPVDCGCFSPQATTRSADQRLREMRWVLVRDLALLALAGHVFVASRRRQSD